MANRSIKEAFQRFWEYVTARIDDQKTVVVNVTEDASGKFTADMTYEQIIKAINAGKDCKAFVHRYNDNAAGDYLPLTSDLTGQYPFVVFSSSLNGYISATQLTIAKGGSVNYYHESTFGISTSTYGFRKIKFSETAETPTNEGDICFKLK